MKQFINGQNLPTASICINKSKLKVYNQQSNEPTYYLENNQEFQIELFNPTQSCILAKIYLNGNIISQGGLVLNPGQRVFLDRYLDIAKKFKFETYEVSNTEVVKNAIKNNGDFKVEFFYESTPSYSYNSLLINSTSSYYPQSGTGIMYSNSLIGSGSITTSNSTFTTSNASYGSLTSTSSSGNLFNSTNRKDANNNDLTMKKTLRSKSIETGRVNAGSDSNQELKTVNKTFNFLPFHTTEYKLQPISQKINTVNDINVKRYCTHCGKKSVKSDKFCSQCGKKI